MAAPIKTYGKGKIQLNIWQGEYDGKVTYSYSLDKNVFDKKTNAWKKSSFLTQTDLQDIHFLIAVFFNNYILKNTKKPPENKPLNTNTNSDDPWMNNKPSDDDVPF